MVSAVEPRRLLFYGGCHAVALQRIFSEFAAVPVVCDSLVNFVLIGAKKPFPLDRLTDYDSIILSPILNKQDYKTDALVEQCKAIGLKTVVYPWLQWNGYFPFASKGGFFTASAWYYGGVPNWGRAASEGEFSQLMSEAFEDAEFIRRHLASTTERLKVHERDGKCDISIRDFILQNYRVKRLFLTPDHPAKPLYDYVVRNISEAVGVPISNSFFWSSKEPQYGIRLPIDPRVSKALRLKFYDADYQHFLGDLGDRYVHYEEYQRILFGVSKGMVVYRANTPTYLKVRPMVSGQLKNDEKLYVPAGTILQVERLGSSDNHLRVRVNWAGNKKAQLELPELSRDCYIFPSHWEFRRPDAAGFAA